MLSGAEFFNEMPQIKSNSKSSPRIYTWGINESDRRAGSQERTVARWLIPLELHLALRPEADPWPAIVRRIRASGGPRSSRIQLAPGERAALESDAAGVPLSTYARAMLFSRSADAVAIRRNPEAAGLMRELNAIGNNLNQIARHLHMTGGGPDDWDELRQALGWLKPAISKVLDL